MQHEWTIQEKHKFDSFTIALLTTNNLEREEAKNVLEAILATFTIEEAFGYVNYISDKIYKHTNDIIAQTWIMPIGMVAEYFQTGSL